MDRVSTGAPERGSLITHWFGDLAAPYAGVADDVIDFTWSPEGRQLLYTTYERQPPFLDRVWAVDLAACQHVCVPREISIDTSAVCATPCRSDAGLLFAGWSATAERVFLWYQPNHSGSSKMDGLSVLSVGIDTAGTTTLPATLVKPSWVAAVPGTTNVVLASGRGRVWDEPRSITSCDVESGACWPVRVLDGPVIDPAVSSTGTRLAFVETDPIKSSNPPESSVRWSQSRRLVVARPDGSNARVIADGGVTAPRWAADNRHLVYWRAGYLWLVDADSPTPPVAIAALPDPRLDLEHGEASFEQFAYILFGDEVWTTADWRR